MNDIVIIGGGVAGATVAWNIYNCDSNKLDKKVLMIECGVAGKGDDTEYTDNSNNIYESTISDDNKNYKPWKSGSNVFNKPGRIKMIVTSPASTTKEFVRHHGIKGLEMYGKIASMGRDYEIKLANKLSGSCENGKSCYNADI